MTAAADETLSVTIRSQLRHELYYRSFGRSPYLLSTPAAKDAVVRGIFLSGNFLGSL